MLKNLEKKLKFVELLDEMKTIERFMFLRNWKKENDAEHSYHLAMMVMVFIDDFPDLNYEKCLKFALIHDIVEIYAWDTSVYDDKGIDTKEEREKAALIKFEATIGDCLPEIVALIHEYEERQSSESKFVYSIDKIQPIIQNVLEWGKKWRDFKIDSNKAKDVAYSKIFPEFWFEKILDIYFKKAESEGMMYYAK